MQGRCRKCCTRERLRHLCTWLPLIIGPAMVSHFGPVHGTAGTIVWQLGTVLCGLSGHDREDEAGKAAVLDPWRHWRRRLPCVFAANLAIWGGLLAWAVLLKPLPGPEKAFARHVGGVSQAALALGAICSVLSRRPFAEQLWEEERHHRQLVSSCRAAAAAGASLRNQELLWQATCLATLLWAAALALSAALQETGVALFRRRTFGETLFCHLLPPLCVLGPVRFALPLGRRLLEHFTGERLQGLDSDLEEEEEEADAETESPQDRGSSPGNVAGSEQRRPQAAAPTVVQGVLIDDEDVYHLFGQGRVVDIG